MKHTIKLILVSACFLLPLVTATTQAGLIKVTFKDIKGNVTNVETQAVADDIRSKVNNICTETGAPCFNGSNPLIGDVVELFERVAEEYERDPQCGFRQTVCRPHLIVGAHNFEFTPTDSCSLNPQNCDFTDPSSYGEIAITEVPEPGTFGLLGLGLIGLGLARRLILR